MVQLSSAVHVVAPPPPMLYGDGPFAVAPVRCSLLHDSTARAAATAHADSASAASLSARASPKQMMDYTNRFLRFMLRRLSHRATLYTEMVTSNTLVHCPEAELSRFLETDGERESPVVLQLGGSNPAQLREAATIAVSMRWVALCRQPAASSSLGSRC